MSTNSTNLLKVIILLYWMVLPQECHISLDIENDEVGFPDAGGSGKFQLILTLKLLIAPRGISMSESEHFFGTFS